jgi:prepilin-type N-terminal cleavage/methylation domain-containing protein
MQFAPAIVASRPRRHGFTLVELLVVITIIAILMALATAGIFQYLDAQTQSNTETNIRTVNKVFQQQWSAVVTAAEKEPLPLSVQWLATNGPQSTANSYFVPDPQQKRARVIWKTLRLVQEFPMCYAEARNPTGPIGTSPIYGALAKDLPPKAGYLTALGTAPAPGGALEPATLLLLSLRQNRGGVMLSVDSLPTGVRGTNVPGLQALRDAWETYDPKTMDWSPQPLAFYRFPTGFPDPAAYPGSAAWELDHTKPNAMAFRNPLDPEGALLDPRWNRSPFWTDSNTGVYWFEKLCHLVHDPQMQRPRSFYAPPIIVSCGRDHSFGHNDEQFGPHWVKDSMGRPLGDMSVTNPTSTNDNIYSFRLRIGARGD